MRKVIISKAIRKMNNLQRRNQKSNDIQAKNEKVNNIETGIMDLLECPVCIETINSG